MIHEQLLTARMIAWYVMEVVENQLIRGSILVHRNGMLDAIREGEGGLLSQRGNSVESTRVREVAGFHFLPAIASLATPRQQ